MVTVIVVNGRNSVGKDTFVSECINYMGKGVSYSTAALPKKIFGLTGWDGVKDEGTRRWLSNCKDFLTDNGDLIWKDVTGFIEQVIDGPAFIFSREPKEIQRFVDYYDAISVLVRRENCNEPQASNHADQEVENYTYECYINNNGTIEDLREAAIDFCDTYLK